MRSALLVAFVAGLGFLAACGGSASPEANTPAANAPSEPPAPEIRGFDAANVSEIVTHKLDASGAFTLDFSRDGKLLACGAWQSVSLIETSSGKELHKFDEEKRYIKAVAFSHDSKQLALASTNSTPEDKRDYVTIWWVGAKTKATTIRPGDFVGDIEFSPDGKWLLTAGGKSITLWEVAEGKKLRTFEGLEGSAKGASFSPDGSTIVSADGHNAILWNAATGAQTKKINLVETYGGNVAYSPDGKLLATGGFWITIWNAETGERVLEIKEVCDTVRFSRDGKILASVIHDRIVFHDAVSGDRLGELKESKQPARDWMFSADGSRLAIAGADGVTIWGKSQ